MGYKKSSSCSLANHPEVLQCLGQDTVLGKIDYYDTKFCRWVKDDWDCLFTIGTDKQIFICCQGVKCMGLQEYLQASLMPIEPLHLHRKCLLNDRRFKLRYGAQQDLQ